MTTFPFFIQSIAIRFHCFFNRKLITDREQEILQREYEEFKIIEHGMAMANEMLSPCVSIVVTPSEIRNWRQLSNYETLLT